MKEAGQSTARLVAAGCRLLSKWSALRRLNPLPSF